MAASLSRNSSGRAAAGLLPYPAKFHVAAAYAGFSADDDDYENVALPLGSLFTPEMALLLYGLYMQATVGPCTAAKPRMWNTQEHFKWKSWSEFKELPSIEAMRLFVRTLEEQDPDWYFKSQGREVEAIGEMPVQDNDLDPSLQEEDIPAVNNSPPSPPLPSANGGIGTEVKMEENDVECSTIMEIDVRNEWLSPLVSGRRPAARYQHAAAVVHDKMFVIGGNHNGRYLNDVQVLDLRTLTWSKVEQKLPTSPLSSSMPPIPSNQILSPCAGHSLIRKNRMLFVVGGHSKNSPDSVSVHAFDTETFTWSLFPTYGQAPIARRGQSVSLIGSNLVMFGGEDSKRRLLNDLNIFDLETMTWEAVDAIGPPPSPRADHAAAVYAGHYLYIFGGGSHSSCFSDLHVLNLKTMEWSRKETEYTPTPRAGHAGATVGDLWYIVGGGDNKSGISETIVLNMKTLDWSLVTSVPARTYIACEGLSLVSACLNGEETLIAFGGYNGKYSNEMHVLKTGISQSKASPAPSFGGSHFTEVGESADVPESSIISKEPVDHQPTPTENGGYNTPKLLELKRELEVALASCQDENNKLKSELSITANDLSMELQSVRGQFVAEQTRCFKLEVEVAELRQKLQSMEALQKEVDLLRRQKAASDQVAAQLVQQKQNASGAARRRENLKTVTMRSGKRSSASRFCGNASHRTLCNIGGTANKFSFLSC
ncbi:acyl-CoA-binding domain-containing protein 6 isoform X3 [Selaginella moellendorffii]|uniref:acyl-CoA-binding domain-containing protein 6 isoform X3 n=1 Tax=Selaginella moellendorffii TaxID=88036 RepID=UPI000D1C7510|nr:acyl-CoA-binding domain-containing protein 6 isoform X3 [Selaginella moellendorffii]|eukprot:XP_024545507.1 acyl-CoA-binding domain-containing protein 6 isoform X3 [Selaginella moellendorffii]